jgi:hypothetical protein
MLLLLLLLASLEASDVNVCSGTACAWPAKGAWGGL